MRPIRVTPRNVGSVLPSCDIPQTKMAFFNIFSTVVNDNAETLNGSFEKVLTQETSTGVHLQPKLPEVHGVGL